MQSELANAWHGGNEEDKRVMLRRALGKNLPVDTRMLDDETPNLDRVAAEVGLVPVLVPAVTDASGLSTLIPAVVDSSFASQYRSRSFRAG